MQSIPVKTLIKYVGWHSVQATTISRVNFRRSSSQEGASYDFHGIATARDNDDTIPKRALLETNRRRDALSSRRCRILPGDRFARQNAEAFYQKGRPFVARHLSSFPYVRSRIASFLARILSLTKKALEGNGTGCLV